MGEQRGKRSMRGIECRSESGEAEVGYRSEEWIDPLMYVEKIYIR
jgi:hypothetical protein